MADSLMGYALRALVGTVVIAAVCACGGGGGGAGGGPADNTIASLVIVDGDGQTATAGTELPRALTARALNAGGGTIPGVVVSFRVTSGGGSVFAGAATTDASGVARERWILGTNAAVAQRVEARAVGAGGAVIAATFTAAAVPGPAVKMVVASGANQSAQQAQTLPSAVVILVQDDLGNGVPGTQVAFAVNGGGTVSPNAMTSDAFGAAQTTWTLGIPYGPHRLTASAPGLPALEVLATATQAPPGAPTRIVQSSGDGQTVMQHALLPEKLWVWVSDALGNGVPGVTVTFAPEAGGPYFNPGSAVTTRPANDAGGYASWQGYFHTAGPQVVEVSVAPGVKVNFTVNVTPSAHRLDGSYICHFSRSNGTFTGVGVNVRNGLVSGAEYTDPGHVLMNTALDEGTGAFTGFLRVSLDYRYQLTGTFEADEEGRSTASGTYTLVNHLGVPQPGPGPGAPIETGSWSCTRE